MAAEWKEKLEKRQEARLSELERKKQERAEKIRPEENPELLLSTFATEKATIEKILCDLGALERNVLRERLEDATKMLQKLQKFVSDSFTFLPSYDVKSMQTDINKLQQELNDKRDSFMPKKKFAFSKKRQTKESQEMNFDKDKVLYLLNLNLWGQLTVKHVLKYVLKCILHFYSRMVNKKKSLSAKIPL